MTVGKGAWYGLCAAMEMASAPDGEMTTVSRVAERYGIPGPVLAKAFQRLVRSGIAVGTRGTRGGYHLAEHASRITMLDVVQAFEPAGLTAGGLPPVESVPDGTDSPWARLIQVFDEVDEQVRCTFASISLETLVSRRR